jgi:hypothetical protein
MDKSNARDLLALTASRRDLLDALDTAMPPYMSENETDYGLKEFDNRLILFFWSVARSRAQARAVLPLVVQGRHVLTSHSLSQVPNRKALMHDGCC